MYQLLSHNDLDGVGCGIVAKLAFGDKVNAVYNSIAGLNYQVESFIEAGNMEEKLIITDLSVNQDNEKRITDFVAAGGQAVLIDHHKSAVHLNEHNWAEVTVVQEDGKQTSATSLLYKYLIDKELLQPSPIVDEFVELVRQYDTWEWDINKNFTAKRLNDLFFMFPQIDFEEKMLKKLTGNQTEFYFDDIEIKLLEVEESRVERYIKRKKREVYQAKIGEHIAGIVHAESYHSELGNELSKEFPHLDYIAIMMVGGKRISLRTMHDSVDVSAIAAKYDGGGHQKASGCNMTDKAFKLFVEATFYAEPLRRDAFKNRYNLKETKQGVLYKAGNDYVFIYYKEGTGWITEINQKIHSQPYADFYEAERTIKRKLQAALTRDDDYISYLTKHYSVKGQ